MLQDSRSFDYLYYLLSGIQLTYLQYIIGLSSKSGLTLAFDSKLKLFEAAAVRVWHQSNEVITGVVAHNCKIAIRRVFVAFKV